MIPRRWYAKYVIRYMPKRPCAIVFTTDDSTILCADKFGDVYSLPLLGRSSEKDPQTPGTGNTSINGDLETSHKPFVPAASTLTVHTRRNQQALKNQHKATNQPKTKRPLEFDHQLLLGHVSLLTDLAYVTLSASGSSQGMDRSYILTSDRDEHIRVSRGLLQAHVIECYCLGHTEFVSKLCIPRWQPQLLVSGGGDDYLLLWDWVSGTARLRVDLKGPVEEFRESYKSSSSYAQNPVLEGRVEKIAVSGIWSMGHLETTAENIQGEIIVACEGYALSIMITCIGPLTLRVKDACLIFLLTRFGWKPSLSPMPFSCGQRLGCRSHRRSIHDNVLHG